MIIKDLLVTADQNYESDEPGTLSLNCGDEVFLLSVTVSYMSTGFSCIICSFIILPCCYRTRHGRFAAKAVENLDTYLRWPFHVLLGRSLSIRKCMLEILQVWIACVNGRTPRTIREILW